MKNNYDKKFWILIQTAEIKEKSRKNQGVA